MEEEYDEDKNYSLQLVQFVIISRVSTQELLSLILEYLEAKSDFQQLKEECSPNNFEFLCANEKKNFESIWRIANPLVNRIPPSQAFQFANLLMEEQNIIHDVEPCFDLIEDPRESSGKQMKRIKKIIREIEQGLYEGEDIRQPPKDLWNHNSIYLTAEHRNSFGDGIVIAHIDQGYQLHSDIKDGLLRVGEGLFGKDFAGDGADAKADTNCTHGCATASVIVGKAVGVAPNAKILPLRTKKKGVVYLNWDPIIRALQYVNERDDINIVSMSLGGPFWSRAVQRQIKRAVKKGIIVIAAAGNKIPFYIVFPANYSHVVSVAASTKENTAWIDSSRGFSIVTTAPGHKIHRALIVNDDNGVDNEVYYASSGTSYATAHIAGVCALWLSKNKDILDKYDAEIRPLLFKKLLEKNELHTPVKLQDDLFWGGGIVNVTKLLNYDISEDVEKLNAEIRKESNFQRGEIPEEQLSIIEKYEELKMIVKNNSNINVSKNHVEELKISIYCQYEDGEGELAKMNAKLRKPLPNEPLFFNQYGLSGNLTEDLSKYGRKNQKKLYVPFYLVALIVAMLVGFYLLGN